MKNILFIITHIGSGAEYFNSILNENERIHIYEEIINFDHPSVIDSILSQPHKTNNNAAVYGTVNYFNKDFSCKSLLKFSKFIYVVREPTECFNIFYKNEKNYNLGVLRYYTFRLRRIYEMATKTPGAILINYQSLINKKDLTPVKEYLYLKEDLHYSSDAEEIEVNTPLEYRRYCQDVFEKYLYKLKNLDLKII